MAVFQPIVTAAWAMCDIRRSGFSANQGRYYKQRVFPLAAEFRPKLPYLLARNILHSDRKVRYKNDPENTGYSCERVVHNPGEMTDAIQILLASGLPGAIAAAAALLLSWRVLRVSADALLGVMRRVWGPTWWGLPAKVVSLGVALWGLSAPISSGLEEIETRWINPVYVNQSRPDSAAIIEIYEMEIRRHTSPDEFLIIRDSTRATASRIGSTPVAIYEAAYLECGLNPFRVRSDQVAAGWIQFTTTGCSGLGITKAQVIQACHRRDAAFIMRCTDAYLRRKAERVPAGTTLRNTIDLYLAIFAPAHIGKAPDGVVYAGFGNPAYEKNSGLDGWKVEQGGKIVRSHKDGRITVKEIWLCLERKKGLLLANFVL
jgi:hypothetical protein